MPGNFTGLMQGWPSLSMDDIEERLERDDAEMRRFFGPEEVEEMRSLSQTQTRAVGLRPAVVVLPGIMGSLLQSTTAGEAILQRETGRIGLAGGDGTVPLVSALLPGIETYYVQCVHARLPSHRDVIQGVIDLTFGGRPPLSTELLEPTRAAIPVRPVIDPDYEAGRLRECITARTMTAQDLEKLYFLV